MLNTKKYLWISFLLLVNVPLTLGGAFDEGLDNPALPRVLLIGDSISIGYTADTREMLKGKANVHRPPLNCMYSSYVAANIKDWLGEEKWDVVHFNAGIWDSHFLDKNGNIVDKEVEGAVSDYSKVDRIRTSLAEYKKNLNIIVDAILSTGAKPVFATTTSVPRWNDKQRAHLNSLNEVAKNLMYYKQVQVNDLYSYSLPHLKEWQEPDCVHFNPLGNKQLARQVSAEILKALGSEAKVLDWMPEKTRQDTIHGRKVTRYQHDCLKRWGYEQHHNEFFYVMKPNMALNKNPLA